MCGIVGMAGDITFNHEKLFKDMLIIDSIRGPHSVGVVSVNTQNEVNHFKKAMYPHDFLETQGFTKLMAKVHRVLIGHNRWATQGVVNNANAHPFEFNKVIGVHNGTLKNQWRLPDSRDFVVDSENIYHSIDKIGIAETYKLIDGAATLVFYDKEKKVLQFIRNEERPLFYTFSEDRKVIFWASEAWMLEGLLFKHKMKHTKIVDTTPHNLYTVKIGEYKANTPLDKLYVKKLEPFQTFLYKHDTKPKQNKLQQLNKVTNNNVTDIHRGSPKKEEISSVKKQYPIGSEIKFSYKGGVWDKKLHALEVFCSDNKDIQLRVFVKSISNKIKDVMQSKEGTDLFSGIVNGYTYNDIVLVQGNSVAEEVEMTDTDKAIAEYFNSTIEFGDIVLNKAEFESLRKSAKDCCWCGSPLEFASGHYPIDDNTTICKNCVEEPGVIDCIVSDR